MNSMTKRRRLTLGLGTVGLLAIAAAIAASLGGAVNAAREPLPSQLAQAQPSPVDVSTRLPDGRLLTLDRGGLTLSLGSSSADKSPQRWLLPQTRRLASLTVLPSGRVLIWGGLDADGRVTEQGMWFDPRTTQLTPAREVGLLPRAGHTATVLSDGRLLLAGGWSPGLAMLSEAELWDERSGTVRVPDSGLAPPRFGHRAQLQADGRVRLSGGVDADGQSAGRDALFDPMTGVFGAAPAVAARSPADAPTLAGSTPTADATNVAPNARLSLRFSEPLRAQALGDGVVTLLGPGGQAAIDVVLAEQGRLAFVTPQQDLFPDSHYTLVVDGAVADSGRPVTLAAVDFKTAALNPGGVPALGTTSTANKPAATAAPRTGAGGQATDDAATAAANTAPTEPQRLMTGTDAGSGLRPANTCRMFGKRFQLCRDHSQLQDGVWRPGKNNTNGRWRIYAKKPPLPSVTLSQQLTAALNTTTLVGRVVQLDERPVAGVEVSIGSLRTRTDIDGQFALVNAPAGRQEVFVDGSTANAGQAEYGQFVVGVDVEAKGLTQLPYQMYLPKITARDKVKIGSPLKTDVVVQHPDLPGMELRLPAGTVVRDRKGALVTELALVPIPVNRAPFPVVDNFLMYFSVQPGGAVIQALTPQAAGGAQVVYPNYAGAGAGKTANFWVYDTKVGWQMYGEGQLDKAGAQYVPEAGVSLVRVISSGYGVSGEDPGSEEDLPPCGHQCSAPGSGDPGNAGDPIDLRTGMFLYSETDIAIADVPSMSLERAYRPRDLIKRHFGIGTASGYEIRLHAKPSNGYNVMELILSNGATVLFNRVSGSGPTGTWAHGGSPNPFSGATLKTFDDGMYEKSGYRVILRNGVTLSFAHTGGKLVGLSDPFGNPVKLVYDAGLLERVETPSGRFIELEVDTSNRIRTARDPIGRTWVYSYNSEGLLSSVKYPDQTTQQYRYDAFSGGGTGVLLHRLTKVIDRKGQTMLDNAYDDRFNDGRKRLRKQTRPDGTIIQVEYVFGDAGPNTEAIVTEPDGSKRRVVFDVSGYPKSDTLAYGTTLAQIWTFERQSGGLITARIDPLGRRTEYSYNALGQVTRMTEQAGTAQARTTTASYTADGDLLSVTNPLNQTTRYTYTNRCLTRIVDALNQATEITCNSAGQPTSVRSPLGKTTLFAYRGYDLASVTDPLNRVSSYRYDALGRVIAAQDPLGNLSRREYDVNGRIAKAIDPSGKATSLSYDGNGNLSTVTLANGGSVAYGYDAMNRLLTRRDGLLQVERWTYDAMGRTKTFTDRNGQVTTLGYDTLGRGKTTTYADASVQTATYDLGDRLLEINDTVSGALRWEYDGFDQTLAEISPQGRIGYRYDAAGRRIGMAAASQAEVTYDYDANSRIRKILQGSETVSFDYDTADRRIKTTLPNGLSMSYGYDDASQLKTIGYRKADGSVLGDLAYAYDPAGRRIAQTGSFASQALPSASTGTNAFDANNRQTQFNGAALAYDKNGNLTGDGARTYVWNARNQLSQIKQGTAVIASFVYDAAGRRIGKTEDGQTVTYLHDGLDPVQETRGATVNTILTGLGIDERYAREDINGRRYFLTDALGSTLVLTDKAGVVQQQYDYTSYGQTTSRNNIDESTNPYQYTGRERDQGGLYYYRARYYSPGSGRFISEDPIGLLGGSNSYAYVNGDPLSLIDPLGLAGAQPTRPPSFFRLTTFEALRNDVTSEQALSNGELFRSYTAPAFIGGLSPSALGLGATAAYPVCPALAAAVPPITAAACRSGVLTVMLGVSICSNMSGTTGSARDYTKAREALAALIEASRKRASNGKK